MKNIRKDFPQLHQEVFGKPLVYLDSGATTLKPQRVIQAIQDFYSHKVANVHRGAHYLSDEATSAYENAREEVKNFIDASSIEEIVFTRGTTESVNLVAASFGDHFCKEGDEILISEMEHHSNIVPWQMLCERKGCHLKVIPITPQGELDRVAYKKLLNEKTKLVAVTHCSNVLGTFNNIKEITQEAHHFGAKVFVDGAQSIPKIPVSMQDLDCDFFAFSGHKAFGPYGIGVLFGKSEILESMPPYQGGGSMIADVSMEKTTYADLPTKFEAGTPHVVGAVGLSEALKYIQELGFDEITTHDQLLLRKATAELEKIEGLTIYGQAERKAAILTFNIEGVHASDVGSLLDQQGIAIRAGHHCTQPLMRHLGVPATARASFSIYNSEEEIYDLVRAINKSKELFCG